MVKGNILNSEKQTRFAFLNSNETDWTYLILLGVKFDIPVNPPIEGTDWVHFDPSIFYEKTFQMTTVTVKSRCFVFSPEILMLKTKSRKISRKFQ